jgi:hypothetical protein
MNGSPFSKHDAAPRMTDPAERSKRSSDLMRKWITIIGVAVLLFLITIFGFSLRIHSMVRNRIERTLQTQFESKVEFSDIAISLFPRVHVTITGLVMRHKGRTDITPLIQVREVSMYANLLSLFRIKPQISFMQLNGLQIHTPPRHPGDEPLIRRTDEDLAKKYPILVREIHADDALIVILRAQPEKPPREFPIHHLQLRDMSFDRPAQFHAVLTNPVPAGVIDATGQFGPWLPEVPSESPAVGQYTFQNADLGSLKGLKGTLSSKGEFSGPLDYLKVNGTTDTPDFSLRMADHPIPLHTDFSAVVNGTNGDTYLNSVTARFLRTTLLVSGKVVDVDPNVKGRTIVLDALSRDARVEDLIRLAVKTDEPVLTGSAKLKTKINIPEGDSDLIDRLKLQGQFGIDVAQFTSPEIQGKIDTLSRKGQGQPKNMDINSVVSEMKGNFQVGDDIVTFSNLNFGVVGASLNLSGTYNLDNGELNFHGKLMLQAKLSQTTTGAKSFFLKALDPFFKGRNAGTVLQIKITGTKDNPTFGLDHGDDSNKEESPPPKTDK